jgi:hypothetical protein
MIIHIFINSGLDSIESRFKSPTSTCNYSMNLLYIPTNPTNIQATIGDTTICQPTIELIFYSNIYTRIINLSLNKFFFEQVKL